ncbi:MAG: YjgN family protein [Cellvibrionaceae bacterium]
MKTLRFDGEGFEYFKIWIVNILLTIVTLGLYYPWAKVRHLRYFYGNTILEERNFDYHATGKQIFMGYLIAIGLLIVYVVIQQISPIGGLLVMIALFVGIPWIIWRSMMFGMRMTSFSNVRFSFDGKLGQAYINFFLLPLLMLICVYGLPLLAIALPAYSAYMSAARSSALLEGATPPVDDGMGTGTIIAAVLGAIVCIVLAIYLFGLIKKRNTMYMINGTQYGQGRFAAELKTAVFVKILLKTIGLSFLMVIVLIVGVAIIASFTYGLGALQRTLDGMGDPSGFQGLIASGAVFLVALLYLGFLFGGFLLAAYSQTRQRNYIVNNTMLDNKIALASTLKARTLAWIMVTNILLIIVTLGFGMPWAKVRMTKYIVSNTQVDTEVGIDSYVTQQQQYQSSLGDQIGDAFDVDVGLAI